MCWKIKDNSVFTAFDFNVLASYDLSDVDVVKGCYYYGGVRYTSFDVVGEDGDVRVLCSFRSSADPDYVGNIPNNLSC